MDSNIVLHLPWAPTVNSYYSHTRNGVFISKKGRMYRESVEKDVYEQLPGIGERTIDYPITMDVYMFPPDRRKRDLDNYMKALQDALTICKLWEDDSLIDQLHIFRGGVLPSGSIVVSISEAGPVIPYEYIDKLTAE